MPGVQVTHFLPGRVRLKVAAARGNPAYISQMRQVLMQVPGIQSLEASPVTGSVLITYDTGRIVADDAAQALAAALRTHFPSLHAQTILKWLNVPAATVTKL